MRMPLAVLGKSHFLRAVSANSQSEQGSQHTAQLLSCESDSDNFYRKDRKDFGEELWPQAHLQVQTDSFSEQKRGQGTWTAVRACVQGHG